MITLNIHWETFDKKSFDRIESLAKKGQISVSIAPYQIQKMQQYQIDRLKEILSQKGYILGQQGLNHKCNKCSTFQRVKGSEALGIDPWHENYCLWSGKIPIKEQEKFMKEGAAQLEKTFGVRPLLYAPPNHFFDLNTVKLASKLGYKWLSNRAYLPLKPYNLEGIIIIPESDPEIENSQFYIHADRWKGDLDKAISPGLTSLDKIKAVKNSASDIAQNRKIKLVSKIARDLTKGYGMPEENAKQCAELLYETKFANDSAI